MAVSVVIRPNTEIGAYDADEDDDFLFDGFVELPQFESIFDIRSPKWLVLGRTGTGKTALVRYIERNFEGTLRIDPKRIALDHIANSDIISFFEELGLELHLFYELLWKHVLCVALIKQMYAINSEEQEISWFDRIRAQFGADRGKVECFEYLREWGKSFWVDTDVQIREITAKFEEQLKAGAQVGIPGFKFTPEYSSKLEEGYKEDILYRARRVVNDIQIGKLNRVLDVLEENISRNKQKKYFICVDNLDDRWVSERIQFKLIRALIEAAKSFRRIRQLKVIIVMRSDFYERALSETSSIGFQKEKYDTYIINIRWSATDLKDFIDKRLNILYKNRYTRQNVHFHDIFSKETRGIPTERYLIERTLQRPRDVIAFINQCFSSAEGQVIIGPKVIQAAEQQYSRRRLEALISEWQSIHPELDILLSFLEAQGHKISLNKIAVKEIIEGICIEILSHDYQYSDDLIKLCKRYMDAQNISLVVQIGSEIMSILYKVGAISMKVSAQQPFQSSTDGDPVIPRAQITMEAEVRVHPMLWRALGVTPNL